MNGSSGFSPFSGKKFVFDLLTKARMLTSKPVKTYIEMNHKLGEYTCWTIPYIVYAVSVVSQFMHALSHEHMNATIYIILRYLKTALGKGLLFAKNEVLMLNDTRMQIEQELCYDT
jgi:hypothetical protein